MSDHEVQAQLGDMSRISSILRIEDGRLAVAQQKSLTAKIWPRNSVVHASNDVEILEFRGPFRWPWAQIIVRSNSESSVVRFQTSDREAILDDLLDHGFEPSVIEFPLHCTDSTSAGTQFLRRIGARGWPAKGSWRDAPSTMVSRALRALAVAVFAAPVVAAGLLLGVIPAIVVALLLYIAYYILVLPRFTRSGVLLFAYFRATGEIKTWDDAERAGCIQRDMRPLLLAQTPIETATQNSTAAN